MTLIETLNYFIRDQQGELQETNQENLDNEYKV